MGNCPLAACKPRTCNLGHAYQALGHIRKAIELHQQALQAARDVGDNQYECFCLTNLGRAYRNLGKIEQAIQHHQEALVIAHRIDDRKEEGKNLGRMGVAYRDLGRFDRAIELYEQALVIAYEIGDRTGERRRLGELGSVYRRLGQLDRAVDLHQQAVHIARETGDLRDEGIWLNSLGLDSYLLGQFEQAIDYHTQALVIAQQTGDHQRESRARIAWSRALLAQGDIAQAQQHCQKALQLDVPVIGYQAALLSGIILLHQRDPEAAQVFATAAQACRALLENTANLYDVNYALAIALTGIAACDPQWEDDKKRAELLAPALSEYQRALESYSAPGVVKSVLNEIEWIRTSGVKGLEPVFQLLVNSLQEVSNE